MKKENLIMPITIILTALILGGSYYAVQYNKQQSIEKQQEKDREDDLLKKKFECEKYTDEIKESIDKENTRPTFLDSKPYNNFEMIFYSPKHNSCLYSIQEMGKNRGYFIYDFLTKERIASFNFPEEYGEYITFISKYSNKLLIPPSLEKLKRLDDKLKEEPTMATTTIN